MKKVAPFRGATFFNAEFKMQNSKLSFKKLYRKSY